MSQGGYAIVDVDDEVSLLSIDTEGVTDQSSLGTLEDTPKDCSLKVSSAAAKRQKLMTLQAFLPTDSDNRQKQYSSGNGSNPEVPYSPFDIAYYQVKSDGASRTHPRRR